FLNDKTDLIGFVDSLGGHQPLKEVLATGRANNFDKVLLLGKLLSQSDVSFKYALVARSPERYLDPNFPMLVGLDHLIVYVPEQRGIEQLLFVDPSCEHCGVGQLPAWLVGRIALVSPAAFGWLQSDSLFKPIVGEPPLPDVGRTRVEAQLDLSGAVAGTIAE